MKRAIIFANGKMDNPPAIVGTIQPGDLVIAADGGSYHCKSLGLTPGVIIGDFDSLLPEEITSYKRAGVEIIQYPSHKNETDLELALLHAVKAGANEVYILGALGARWDMTIANIMLIAHPMFNGLKIRLLEGNQEFILLRGKEQVDLKGRPGDAISLIPLAGDTHGITTWGLEYPLKDETLYFGSPRGVSNRFMQDYAQIEVREGVLLCILDFTEN